LLINKDIESIKGMAKSNQFQATVPSVYLLGYVLSE